MPKKLCCLLLGLLLLLPVSPHAEAGEELHILLSADLHFTQKPDASIYPMMNRIEDLGNAMADAVIETRPDAFILCGDITNSGRNSDKEALAKILQRVHAAGIPVIVVPGNHDFDLGDAESFERAFGGLCEAEERDSASLSYMLHLGAFRILAMDDSSFRCGAVGQFSKETMQWLRQQLKNAKESGEEVLFLSHYNVLPGGEAAADSRYMIQNPELRDLLIEYGVRLCLSGHRHSQEILSSGDLYEIVSAMPAVSPHLIGEISVQNDTLRYSAKPLDIQRFDSTGALSAVLEQESVGAGSFSKAVDALTDWTRYSLEEREAVTRLFGLFMANFGSGSLADVQGEILNDPYCELYLELFDNTNYGPWMRYLLESELRPGNHLELDLSDHLP